jgi:Lrp/AsnC family transcriptional regulator for asnA, asnC and gidA
MKTRIDTIQNIPGISRTETMVSLDQAIERQVWVKDYDYIKAVPRKRRG